MNNDWTKVLFDVGDGVCCSDSAKGTSVYTIHNEFGEVIDKLDGMFTCINALDVSRDNAPTASYHSPSRPRRADANVTKLRTILVEFDGLSLEEQVAKVSELEMPYSLMTYSGGKSFHFLITLAEPLATRESYDVLVRRVYKALGGRAAGLDESTKNPSRFTRTPNAIRDNGVKQELVEIKGRVQLATLEAWLAARGVGELSKPKLAGIKPRVTGVPNWKAPLSAATQYFLMFEAPEGEWNTSCFKAACDMVRSGYTEEEIIERMEASFGSLDSNVYTTISSAVRRAIQDGT